MAENTSRNVFGLNGITGMLIATVLLISILVGLTIWGLGVQQANADKFYQLDNESKIQFSSTDNAAHRKIVGEK